MTILVEKNILLAGTTTPTCAVRSLYHIYKMFAIGGEWYAYGQITDQKLASDFSSETAVVSGDWFVVQFSARLKNEKIHMFFGARDTDLEALGPYSASDLYSTGLLVGMGFAGDWDSETGFLRQSIPISACSLNVETWNINMALETEKAGFYFFAASNGVSTPNTFNIGIYCGEYRKDSNSLTIEKDHFNSVILAGNPSIVAARSWGSDTGYYPCGYTYNKYYNLVLPVRAIMKTDTTLVGNDSSNLAAHILLAQQDKNGTARLDIGTIGMLNGIFQVYSSAGTDGDTTLLWNYLENEDQLKIKSTNLLYPWE